MKTVGEALIEIRERSGVSIADAADCLELSVQGYNAIESDTVKPSDKQLSALRELFGIDPYVYLAAKSVDASSLPEPTRGAASKLLELWKQDVARVFAEKQ